MNSQQPTSQHALLARVRQLHEDLSAVNTEESVDSSIDEETLAALKQLATDVENSIQASESQPDSSQEEATHSHDLFDRIEQFREEHPRLTRFLSQMTDVLAMMGI